MEEFLKTLSDVELVSMQNAARQAGDEDLKSLVLVELGNRQKAHDVTEHTTVNTAIADATGDGEEAE